MAFSLKHLKCVLIPDPRNLKSSLTTPTGDPDELGHVASDSDDELDYSALVRSGLLEMWDEALDGPACFDLRSKVAHSIEARRYIPSEADRNITRNDDGLERPRLEAGAWAVGKRDSRVRHDQRSIVDYLYNHQAH
jgi:hypothetical protein